MLTIPCYFVDQAADDKNRFFVCEQQTNAFVFTLLESLHGKLQRSKHDVDFDNLLLFKTNLQPKPRETLLQRARNALHGRSKVDALPVDEHLSSHFAGVLDEGAIQLLVATKALFEPGDVTIHNIVAHDTIMRDPHPRPPKRARFEESDIPLTLNCQLFRGEICDNFFALDIVADRHIADLANKIKVNLAIHPWTAIQLVQVFLSIDDMKQVKPSTITEGVLVQDTRTIADVFGKPRHDLVNVIVVVPPTIESPPVPSLPSFGHWRQHRERVQLPALGLLEAYLNTPLPDPEKIPIPEETLRNLVSNDDSCTERDVLSVFRLVGAPIDKRAYPFVTAVIDTPPTSGTEDLFHLAWDQNIRIILERCAPGGISQRNSSRHTATRNLRPDYAYRIAATCPFRGEEKGPANPEDPRQELADKLTWVFGSTTPYILGYYAHGTTVTLVALAPPLRPDGNIGIHDLVEVNLSRGKQRIQNLQYLINLSSLLEPLAQLMGRSGPEFDLMERDTCTIEITSSVVVKTYRDSTKAEHLRSVHHLLKANNVPNTDYISYTDGNVVHLQPRGIANRPRSRQELYECLRCVLEALVAAHRIPLYHRDVRLENVIRRIDDPSLWFLIDWEDACGRNALAQPHFARTTHSPDVFCDDHGPEVDIWGVGQLIKGCSVLFVGLELQDFANFLQANSKTLTAGQALQKLDQTCEKIPKP